MQSSAVLTEEKLEIRYWYKVGGGRSVNSFPVEIKISSRTNALKAKIFSLNFMINCLKGM